MKISAGRAEGFIARPDPAMPVVVLYGPDDGLVAERGLALVKGVVEDPRDPFRVSEMTGAEAAADPARLSDEAAALALTGGRRVVRLREAGDRCAEAVAALLEQDRVEALVVIEAGDLPPRSSLRRLAESATAAAAVPCYRDEVGNLDALISQTLAAAGLTIARPAAEALRGRLGGDRLLSRAELDKLVVYMGVPGGGTAEVSAADVAACVADTAGLSLENLAYAVSDGNPAATMRLLDRLLGEGESTVGLLRVVSTHFLRLHRAGSAVAAGRRPDQAMAALQPPVFFRVKDRFLAALRRWSPERCGQAIELLLEAEEGCKTTGAPDREICGRALLRLAAMRSGRT